MQRAIFPTSLQETNNMKTMKVQVVSAMEVVVPPIAVKKQLGDGAICALNDSVFKTRCKGTKCEECRYSSVHFLRKEVI
jgi:hypothetical protein